jgi:crotonobetainyl-CoA:carnitine CoA-transferase CaiB-like acyl-CoA transferase
VVDLDTALDGELVRSRGMVVSVETPEGPLRMLGNPIRVSGVATEHRAPPRLHEHTAEVLDALGPHGPPAPGGPGGPGGAGPATGYPS